jgi:thiol-disulfide isomerase/thioredoxin
MPEIVARHRDVTQWQSPNLRALLFCLAFCLTGALPESGRAAAFNDADAIPHVSQRARDAYSQEFLTARAHRAFAIAPGGGWAWTSGQESAQAAGEVALRECQQPTGQRCLLYALDDRLVFSREQWVAMWGPYKTAQQAAVAPGGTQVGERFPDLAFTTPAGVKQSVSSLRGKLVLVHFWGSWCPPCLRELPSLDLLQQILDDRLPDDVVMVLLQLREPIATSRSWVKRNGFNALRLYDSGAGGEEENLLRTVAGEKIADRNIARVFPSSYVLDRNGIVVFSHVGTISDWSEYLPFFENAAAASRP